MTAKIYHLTHELTTLACDSIEDVLNELGVNHRKYRKVIMGECPIHIGDNPTALNIYPEGDEVRGYWRCNTHHCEKKWSSHFIGFIRGVLSTQRGKEVSVVEAATWLANFIGYKTLNEVPLPTEVELRRRQQDRAQRKLNLLPEQKSTGWSRTQVRSMIKIPAEYYLNRGYDANILDKYDVGFYKKTNRVAVPIYDDNYKFCVGFTARSLHEKCELCGLHHSGSYCPQTLEERLEGSKWRHSLEFTATSYLYNYWFAKEIIAKTNVAILVEGPGDVWRLEEHGIHNSVALFGCNLSPQQIVILAQSGAMSLIVMTDNDEAGQKAAKQIKQQIGRSFRLFFPKIASDAGDLHGDEVTKDIRPIIEKATRCSCIHC